MEIRTDFVTLCGDSLLFESFPFFIRGLHVYVFLGLWPPQGIVEFVPQESSDYAKPVATGTVLILVTARATLGLYAGGVHDCF